MSMAQHMPLPVIAAGRSRPTLFDEVLACWCVFVWTTWQMQGVGFWLMLSIGHSRLAQTRLSVPRCLLVMSVVLFSQHCEEKGKRRPLRQVSSHIGFWRMK